MINAAAADKYSAIRRLRVGEVAPDGVAQRVRYGSVVEAHIAADLGALPKVVASNRLGA